MLKVMPITDKDLGRSLRFLHRINLQNWQFLPFYSSFFMAQVAEYNTQMAINAVQHAPTAKLTALG